MILSFPAASRVLRGPMHLQQVRSFATTTTPPPQIWYRLLYFDTRGAAEPIRYLLAIHKVAYQDVRYPIQASFKGFGVDETYLQDQAAGKFKANLNRVPILQIVQRNEEKDKILAEMGQTHSILRFLDQQHGTISTNPLQTAFIDAFVEHVRDVKSAWYKSKGAENKQQILSVDLPGWCRKLEASLPPKEDANNAPWLIGNHLSLADVTLYAMLATPVSLMTGSSQSFFDGAARDVVENAYKECSRLRQSVQATAKLPEVQQWEERRPDTFN